MVSNKASRSFSAKTRSTPRLSTTASLRYDRYHQLLSLEFPGCFLWILSYYYPRDRNLQIHALNRRSSHVRQGARKEPCKFKYKERKGRGARKPTIDYGLNSGPGRLIFIEEK
jgi:hypothetical protein